jgi:predicted solute-binding protein
VNEFSVSLGMQGKHAVNQMFQYAIEAGIISNMPERIFAPDL